MNMALPMNQVHFGVPLPKKKIIKIKAFEAQIG